MKPHIWEWNGDVSNMFKFERGMGLLTISWAAHPNLWRFPKMGDQQKCSIFGRFGCTPFRKSLYRRFFFHRILRSIGCGSQPILLGLALTTGGRKVLRGCLLGVINRHNHPLKESQDDEKTIYIYNPHNYGYPFPIGTAQVWHCTSWCLLF